MLWRSGSWQVVCVSWRGGCTHQPTVRVRRDNQSSGDKPYAYPPRSDPIQRCPQGSMRTCHAAHPTRCRFGPPRRSTGCSSMKRNRCWVVPFLLLAGAQGFGTKLASLKHYGSLLTGYHPCCSNTPRFSNTVVVSCQRAEGSAERDNRIDPNPEALQQWFSSVGGAIGPVGLEGES